MILVMNTRTYTPVRIIGTLLAIVISLGAQAHSGSEDQRVVRADIESKIASFRLNAAEQRADQLSDAGYRAFYKSTILVYKYMASQDAAYLQSFRNGFDAATSAVSSVSDNDPLKKVMLSDLYCKRAVLEFLTENYLTAVRYTRTGRNYIRENQTAFPNNVEQKRILGLFNVILGAVPSKYQWLTNMLGYEGNVNSGIRQLEEAASSGSTLLRLESQFILYYVERNMLNLNESAIRRIEGERTRLGGSILLDFLVASANQSIKQNEKSLAILVQRDKYVSSDIFFIPYWDYLLGKAYYYKDDHTHAQQSLARFLKGYKGKMFRTDANFRLGMSLTLNGAYSSGKYFFQLVANRPEAILTKTSMLPIWLKNSQQQRRAVPFSPCFAPETSSTAGIMTGPLPPFALSMPRPAN